MKTTKTTHMTIRTPLRILDRLAIRLLSCDSLLESWLLSDESSESFQVKPDGESLFSGFAGGGGGVAGGGGGGTGWNWGANRDEGSELTGGGLGATLVVGEDLPRTDCRRNSRRRPATARVTCSVSSWSPAMETYRVLFLLRNDAERLLDCDCKLLDLDN